jgi:alpha-1,2-mannosyltransferase
VLTAIAATLLGAALLWHDTWQFWTRLLWQPERIGHPDRLENQSIMGALARLGDGDPARPVWALLVVLIMAYGLWRAGRAGLAGDEVSGLTLTALVGCLVSPVTWSHHLLWFVPALVVLADAALGARRSARRWWPPAALALVLYVTTTFSVISWYGWHVVDRSAQLGFAGVLIDNWYVLLMLALLVTLPFRAPETGGPNPAPTGNPAGLDRMPVAGQAT